MVAGIWPKGSYNCAHLLRGGGQLLLYRFFNPSTTEKIKWKPASATLTLVPILAIPTTQAALYFPPKFVDNRFLSYGGGGGRLDKPNSNWQYNTSWAELCKVCLILIPLSYFHHYWHKQSVLHSVAIRRSTLVAIIFAVIFLFSPFFLCRDLSHRSAWIKNLINGSHTKNVTNCSKIP